jgi:hypothetical protein
VIQTEASSLSLCRLLFPPGSIVLLPLLPLLLLLLPLLLLLLLCACVVCAALLRCVTQAWCGITSTLTWNSDDCRPGTSCR